MKDKVSIVVTNWNGKKILSKSLPQILKNSPEASEIIIADDASSDGSQDFILSFAKEDSRVIPKLNSVNLGFGKNSNKAVFSAKNDLVVLLNNDIYPHPGYITFTLSHFTDPKLYGVGFAETDNENWARIYWSNGYLQYEPQISSTTHISAWVSGGSSIVRKSIFTKLGGFDNVYEPFYSEDLDLGLRAWRSGYKLLWEPKSLVTHKHETTTSKFPKRFLDYVKERNRLLVVLRNITSPDLLLENKIAQIGRILFGPNYIKIIRAAHRQIKNNPPPICNNLLSDKELLSLFK